MSLGLVMVGAEVGDMVGDLLSSSQSTAAPGSRGGTHLLGAAVTVGAPLGSMDGTRLGGMEEEGAADVVGWFEVVGNSDGS